MKQEKTIKVVKAILTIIAVAGVVGMATVAPNAIQALDVFYKQKNRKYHKESYIKSRIRHLIDSGMIELVRSDNKHLVRLTPKGEQKLLKYQLGEMVIKQSDKWDGKWRIIAFDIKEGRRGTREMLRRELFHLGFVRLQDSVWVSPYECEDLIILLKSSLSIGKDVLYVVAEKIENDKWLRRKFGLK